MIYRNEIDGLRALAVSSVVIFHFFSDVMPLGFLGVDMFFVISGFLISAHIIEGKNNKDFSILEFYKRRAKRILPAAFMLIILVLLVSKLILLTTDFNKFYPSVISSYTFLLISKNLKLKT